MSFKLFIRGRDGCDAAPVANLANPLIQDPPISGLAELAANDSQKPAPAPEPISGLAELASYYARPNPLVWLREFIGADTVPVAAVRDAAHEAAVPWLSVLSLKGDWLIEQKSMDRLYWKFVRCDWRRPTEPAIDRRPMASEYHRHHFQCVKCQAAGRGAGYGLRCAVGWALWISYTPTSGP